MESGSSQMGLLEALISAPDLARSLLDEIDALVLVLDQRGYPVLLNRACEEATGLTLEEVGRQPFWERFCPAEEAVDASAAFSELRSGGEPVQREAYWQTADRKRLRVRSVLRPLRDAEGVVQRVLCTACDIDHQDRALRELELRCGEVEQQLREQHDQAASALLARALAAAPPRALAARRGRRARPRFRALGARSVGCGCGRLVAHVAPPPAAAAIDAGGVSSATIVRPPRTVSPFATRGIASAGSTTSVRDPKRISP